MTHVVLIAGKAMNGKDTMANYLKENLNDKGFSVLIIHFADYLKFICSRYFGWSGNKDDEGRELLQKVGTDIVRTKHPTFWLDNVIEFIKVFGSEYDYILIPDVRFRNELYFKKGRELWDVTSVKVIRNNFQTPLTKEQQSHPSETDLDNQIFDLYFKASNLDELRFNANTLASIILFDLEKDKYD